MPDKRVAKGVWKTSSGWRVYVRVNGKLRPKRLPKTMTLGEVNEWRRNWRTDLRRGVDVEIETTPGTFAEDVVQDYLPAKRAMPTYATRVAHMMEWVAFFGDRPRSSIKSHEIAAQRDRWLLHGPRKRMKKEKGTVIVVDRRIVWEAVDEPLGPHSVNLRLRALSNFFAVLNGRHGYNPVREVEECEEPEELPRALPTAVLDAIFAAAPDRGQATRDNERPDVSISKIRARCLRWTGIAPCDLQRVRAHHLQLDRERVWITPRRKGKRKKGAKAQRVGRWIHLLPEALAAFRDLVDADAVGPFSVSSLNKTFQRWCAAAGYGEAGITLYALRHSVGTDAYEAGGDIKAVQEILGQADLRSTARYVRAAVNPRAKAVLEQMRAKRLAPKKVTRKGTRRRRSAA